MKKILIFLSGAVCALLALPYFVFEQPAKPSGTSEESGYFEFTEAKLLIDRTAWSTEEGRYVQSHSIFDTILEEIRTAETGIVADFFLWNPWKGGISGPVEYRALADELADALIEKRRKAPDMPIVMITDPVNRIYGVHLAPNIQRLIAAGIPVIFTDIDRLPDSNRVFAPQADFWGRFFGQKTALKERGKGSIPNPFDPTGTKLSFAELGRLLYFKANHRKVLVTGRNDGRWRLVIGSLNPADGSANHSNVGVLVEGAVAQVAAESELTVAGWSLDGEYNDHLDSRVVATVTQLKNVVSQSSVSGGAFGPGHVAWRSEGAIRRELISLLGKADRGCRIDAAVFYFSDRGVIEALKGAVQRGATVRLLLDANRDAFGREKNGIPNRPVAAELMALNEASEQAGRLSVRWAATNGEQYHAKVLRLVGEGQDVLLLGSANWTRRNLDDLNLEANVIFDRAMGLGLEFDAYFDSIWMNESPLGLSESVPYEAWAESGWSLWWKTWLYRFQEWSGASTF